MNFANSNENHQTAIKSEVDECPNELKPWDEVSENLRRPIKSEEDEVMHPSDPPESAECYAIKTEELHIYSVLPEEEIHEPSEPSPGSRKVRRSARKATDVEYSEEIDSTSAEEFSIRNDLKCYICPTAKNFESVETLDHHLEEFHPHKDSYQCPECNEISVSINIFNKHLLKHDVELRSYKCRMCPSRFNKEGYRRLHEVLVHSISYRAKRRFCSKCKKCVSNTKWDEHICSPIDIIHICLICDFEFSTSRSLNKHITDVHDTAPAKQIFRCYLCEPATDMKDEETLQVHLLASHPRQDVSHCKECDKYFQKVTSYNLHLERHDAVARPFKCGHCPLRFETNRGMRRHEVGFHQANDKRVKRRCCRICKKSILSDNFEKHMQTSHPCKVRQVFRCYFCKPTTDMENETSLQKHLLASHPLQDVYNCTECDKSFQKRTNYNLHLQRHDANLRPFKCSHCPCRFTIKGSMRQHEVSIHQVNNGIAKRCPVKKRRCRICKEKIACDKFEMHMQTMHPNDVRLAAVNVKVKQLFRCYLCEPATDMEDENLLQEHLLASHPEQDEYHCTTCNKNLHEVRKINQHLQRHDASVRPFKCGHCPLRFTERCNMRQHEVNIHQANNGRTKSCYKKRSTCRICNKRIYLHKFEEHMQTKHPTSSHAS